MKIDVELSFIKAADDCGIVRDAPLPEKYRNKAYYSRYDFETIFYDVYRCGKYTVLQGPPLFNFRKHIEESGFYSDFAKRGGAYIERLSGAEYWLKADMLDVRINSPLADAIAKVQPDLNHVFHKKRVLFTLSKDNDVQWIKDWVQFHVRVHGADAVLLYDNSSTPYSSQDLEAELKLAFPELTVCVVSWPFKFGPRVWRRHDANGSEERISSKFCQAGALQHARFRFLQKARSVLNCDVDELVLASKAGGSVFKAAETSLFGAVHFRGRWIIDVAGARAERTRRHADFAHYDTSDKVGCPQKWAVVPWRCARSMTWSAHRVKGLENYFTRSNRFTYAHFSEITTNWKYHRTARKPSPEVSSNQVDHALLTAMRTAGLHGVFLPAA
ncbi:MAG TPA: glycosyltransferase family 92 protein [Mycoplana sp.]|nr:glycosyltransferase family 92 protein [Mycoplana sp.]